MVWLLQIVLTLIQPADQRSTCCCRLRAGVIQDMSAPSESRIASLLRQLPLCGLIQPVDNIFTRLLSTEQTSYCRCHLPIFFILCILSDLQKLHRVQSRFILLCLLAISMVSATVQHAVHRPSSQGRVITWFQTLQSQSRISCKGPIVAALNYDWVNVHPDVAVRMAVTVQAHRAFVKCNQRMIPKVQIQVALGLVVKLHFAEVPECWQFCELLSSMSPVPPHRSSRELRGRSEWKPVVLSIRSFLYCTAGNCATPHHLLTQICWGVLLSRHAADWMDLERHQELMWIKEPESCNQERKRKLIY